MHRFQYLPRTMPYSRGVARAVCLRCQMSNTRSARSTTTIGLSDGPQKGNSDTVGMGGTGGIGGTGGMGGTGGTCATGGTSGTGGIGAIGEMNVRLSSKRPIKSSPTPRMTRIRDCPMVYTPLLPAVTCSNVLDHSCERMTMHHPGGLQAARLILLIFAQPIDRIDRYLLGAAVEMQL